MERKISEASLPPIYVGRRALLTGLNFQKAKGLIPSQHIPATGISSVRRSQLHTFVTGVICPLRGEDPIQDHEGTGRCNVNLHETLSCILSIYTVSILTASFIFAFFGLQLHEIEKTCGGRARYLVVELTYTSHICHCFLTFHHEEVFFGGVISATFHCHTPGVW